MRNALSGQWIRCVTMPIDLHTHSDRSDGTQSPRELVMAANRLGLDAIALTDHDTTEGWDEAVQAAETVGIGLVPGLEISCRYLGAGVHLLAYFVDPRYGPLLTELDRILDGRNSRIPAIVERLRDLGIDITAKDVRHLSGQTAAMGRPHVADALVAKGVCTDRDDAFRRFLSPGRPAYVDRYAADLVEMIGLVGDAGGVSVIAHPWTRSGKAVLDDQAIGTLAAEGLVGVEVDHPDHDERSRARLRRIATDLDLVITGSSDCHGEGKASRFALGVNSTARSELDRLVALAGAAAAATHRPAPPGVVR
jgi:predicted metal-dependent phosphoesterase TrpH